MILFEGKILNIGTPTKPSSKIETRAFSEVDRVSAATHLKLRDSDKFIEITDGMVIKRKKDSSGNPTDNMTSFAHIKKNEEYVCVIDGAEIAISSCLYAQIVFVKKSERGNLLKCKDGVYVRKDEVQVPAYKKVAEKAPLQVAHDGDYFIQREIVRLPNGTEIVVPDPRVKKEEDKWLFTEDSGRTWKECEAKKEIDSRLYIKYVLVDNKVVNIQKLTEQPNGDYVIKGDIAGTDIIVGKKNPKLERAFVQGSSFVRKTKFFEADNLLEQRGNLNNEKHDIAYRRDEPDSNGLVAVDINRSRTSVMFTYRDASGAERREIYALENANSRSRHRATGAKLIRVRSFKLIETSNGISIEFEQIKPNVAQDVVFRSGKLNSYTMNDRKITHIKWESVDGYDMISSYIIDGTKLSDIEWNAEHKIERCKVHLINDDGREVVKEIDDFANSEYAYLAITYKLTSTLEDVKISDGKLSFTMGDYKFKDAELITGGKIGKCKLIHNGEEEEINLSTDSRFTQLKLAVEVSLDESKITPLIQSELLAKKDDHYVLEADIIQSGEMKEVYDEHGKLIEGGVVDAVKLKSVDHAIDEQQKFKDHPYKTVVIDSQDKNKTHVITDFATTYEDSSQFELNQDVLTDMVGKQKIEVKKGEVSIDSKKTDDRRDSLIVVGFSLGVFGIPLVMAGVAVGVVSPILRAIKKTALENVDIKTCQQDTQKNVANQCRTNIRNLTASFKRELALYKRQYSEKEFMAKAQELEAEFRFKYVQELGKLQLLGGGEIACEFDPSKKVKLHCGNHMAYLV
ncbi:MAG: hypothetical protein IJ371_05375, partial [Clostridia bacterium]|nr:hypothetical protein [Clostridia bacterium]